MRRLWNIVPVFLLVLAFATITPAAPIHSELAANLGQASSEMEASGELQKVDATNQTFTIKAANGEQLQFSYNENTKVEGSTEGVQGLASQSGSQVTVRYKEESGRKVATSIAIQKK